MPASQASTEIRLPRQVQRRVAQAVQRYQPESEDSPTASATDPAAPTAPPAAPAAPAAEPAADTRHNDPRYWKARFEVTSGMLTKERADRKADREELERRMTELQTQIRTLQAATPAAPIDVSAYFTPEEIERYGQEQCEVMARTAMRAAGAAEKSAREATAAEVQPLKEREARKAEEDAKAAQQSFIDALLAAEPDFDDNDPRWLAWLQEIDERTGTPRQAVLTIHVGSRNVAQCLRIIREWKASVQPPAPPVAPAATGATPGAGDAPAPTEAAVSALTAPSDAEVRDFYKRSTLGKVGQEERVAFEARMKLRQPRR